ncbi:hypothetical protein P154DRAFT_575181 [Amniculicola lignicola CBS 123094]|uniref:Uncharacterized protein n=1 Tax=Amniculicola lignicola CBS 123094 TaxID=1392246 RepID=A0A6A5WIF5_9PLEO|nr:hypothetical protein P154DRAFT_575181 [Amniculicola lignicola CBS 123094]
MSTPSHADCDHTPIISPSSSAPSTETEPHNIFTFSSSTVATMASPYPPNSENSSSPSPSTTLDTCSETVSDTEPTSQSEPNPCFNDEALEYEPQPETMRPNHASHRTNHRFHHTYEALGEALNRLARRFRKRDIRAEIRRPRARKGTWAYLEELYGPGLRW